jgi:hypothetical protein
MAARETLNRLETRLRRKEAEARKAKETGMHATYGNRMAEIMELKQKITKLSMGGR